MDRKERERLWAECYKNDRNAVRDILLKRESDYDVVDDLTQETYTNAWEKLDEWNEKSEFLTWVCGIAKHVMGHHLEKVTAMKRANEVLEVYLPHEMDEESTPVPYYDRADLSADVEAQQAALDPALIIEAEDSYAHALDSMSYSSSIAVRMRHDGYDNHQIARNLGVSDKTVRNLLSESRKYFRDNSEFIRTNRVSERDEAGTRVQRYASQSEVERAEQERFEKRCSAFEKRRIRQENPDKTTEEWKEMYS